MGKLVSTVINVSIAVGISLVIWVGANFLFNQVRGNWRRFSALSAAMVGFVAFVVLHGNRLLVSLGPDADTIGSVPALLWPAVIGAVIFGAAGWFFSAIDDSTQRLQAGAAGGLGIGVLIGVLFASSAQPALDPLALVLWTAILAGVGAAWSTYRGHAPIGGALVAGAFGAILGGFGSADIGDGSVLEAIVAAAVPATMLGARIGLTKNADQRGRARIDVTSRSFIFLLPALTFISIALVIPTIRTFYLSLLDRRSEEWVQLGNYVDVFQNPKSFDVGNWPEIFTSRLFFLGVAMLIAAAVVAFVSKAKTGRAFELGGPAIAPMVLASALLAFAVLSVLRGTIMNNLWWVFTVTIVSTGLGLAIAVLADNARFESAAKALIFMPMAVSLVGASTIWRFMFIARDSSKDQTGVLNFVWVGVGRLSAGSGIPTFIASVVLGFLFLGLLVRTTRILVRGDWMSLPIPLLVLGLSAWLWLRFTAIVGNGMGGVKINGDGEVIANPVLFVQEQPFNSVWLMLILIWIQTGFAMVILSSAIKAVPTELLEAARVDGAEESQIFWRVVLPQIATTIGVVVTTLIVLVMKVFDIVKVVTNGNFGTQVLANDFFLQAFSNTERGRGAALAVLLFISVLPVMVFNIRKMQQDA